MTSAFRDSLLADRGIAVATRPRRQRDRRRRPDRRPPRPRPDPRLPRRHAARGALARRDPALAARPQPAVGLPAARRAAVRGPDRRDGLELRPRPGGLPSGRLARRAPARPLARRDRGRGRRAAPAPRGRGAAHRQHAGAHAARLAAALGPARRDRRHRRLAPRPPRRPRPPSPSSRSSASPPRRSAAADRLPSAAVVRSPDNEAVVLAMWAAYDRDGLPGVLEWAAEDAEWHPHSAEQSVFHTHRGLPRLPRGGDRPRRAGGLDPPRHLVAGRGRGGARPPARAQGRQRRRLAHVLGAPRARRQGALDRLVPGPRQPARGGRAAGPRRSRTRRSWPCTATPLP